MAIALSATLTVSCLLAVLLLLLLLLFMLLLANCCKHICLPSLFVVLCPLCSCYSGELFPYPTAPLFYPFFFVAQGLVVIFFCCCRAGCRTCCRAVLLITVKQIAGVHFFYHIGQLGRLAIRDNHITDLFKLGHIGNNAAVIKVRFF